MTEYDRESRYSVRPLSGRFPKMDAEYREGMHEYAQQKKLDVEYADVLNVIRQHYKEEPESAWIFEQRTGPVTSHAFPMADREIYGAPLVQAHLVCGPTNEAGVVFLFGMLAGQLGLLW